MKRIVALSFALLTAVGSLFAVTSCGKKGDYDFSAEVKASEIIIYDGEKVFQSEKYPAEKLGEFDLECAKDHVSFVDVDFDGYKDLCLAVGRNGDVIRYIFWLFDSKTELFVYSQELSKLTTVAVNSDKKQLISSVVEDGKLYYETYAFEKGQLKMISKTASDSPDVPDDVSEAVKNNTIGYVASNTGALHSDSAPSEQASASNTQNSDSGTKNTTASSGNNSGKPATTAAQTGDIRVATGDIDDGWF